MYFYSIFVYIAALKQQGKTFKNSSTSLFYATDFQVSFRTIPVHLWISDYTHSDAVYIGHVWNKLATLFLLFLFISKFMTFKTHDDCSVTLCYSDGTVRVLLLMLIMASQYSDEINRCIDQLTYIYVCQRLWSHPTCWRYINKSIIIIIICWTYYSSSVRFAVMKSSYF